MQRRYQFSSVAQSIVSDSLRPRESQHARPLCPSPTPRVYSNSCPSTGDVIQPPHPLLSPSPPAPNPSQHQGLFQWFNSFIKRLFSSSSLSAIRVVSSAYLRLLIFLPAILIPACASSSPEFLMMYSAYKLNTQGDNIQPWRPPLPIWNQSFVPHIQIIKRYSHKTSSNQLF